MPTTRGARRPALIEDVHQALDDVRGRLTALEAAVASLITDRTGGAAAPPAPRKRAAKKTAPPAPQN